MEAYELVDARELERVARRGGVPAVDDLRDVGEDGGGEARPWARMGRIGWRRDEGRTGGVWDGRRDGRAEGGGELLV